MKEEGFRSRSGILFLIAGFGIVVLAAVFAFVPLVECHRCDKEGQFVTEAVRGGKREIGFDYCDCATFFELGKTGRRGRISFLKTLQKPRSLIIDYQGTGKGYTP